MSATTDLQLKVFFFEREFYCLSNFSAFRVTLNGVDFDTAEAAYQWLKFPDDENIQSLILAARSAHEAAELGRANKHRRRADWNMVKLDAMRSVLFAKTEQHPIVRRRLLETGGRQLVEDSSTDAFWGWGPNQLGKNQMGRLWMEIRSDLLLAENELSPEPKMTTSTKPQKPLKLFNGRGICCRKSQDPLWKNHPSNASVSAYIAAFSRADAARVIEEYCGTRPSAGELKNYFTEGHWGNSMDGIEPERGLWLKFRNTNPVRVL